MATQAEIYVPSTSALRDQSHTGHTPFHLGYRPELDGVRGVSIILVLGLHLIPRFVPGGYLGVEVFFVLSGFLITSLLLEEWNRKGSINLRDFYLRRALRLGPALVVYLLLLVLYATLFMRHEDALDIYTGALLTLAYVSNWVIAFYPSFPIGILAITWSLAVEEQFYLFWPLTLSFLLHRALGRRGITVCLLVALALVSLQQSFLFNHGASFRRLYYATDTRAFGLLLGCLLGCLVSWQMLPRSRVFSGVMKLLALLAALFVGYIAITLKSNNSILFKGVFAAATISIATILAALVLWPEFWGFRLLKFKPLVWVGRISYGLYLWHWPVRGFVFGSNSQPSIWRILLAAGLSFAISILSFYIVEKPFLRQKRKFSHA